MVVAVDFPHQNHSMQRINFRIPEQGLRRFEFCSGGYKEHDDHVMSKCPYESQYSHQEEEARHNPNANQYLDISVVVGKCTGSNRQANQKKRQPLS